MNTLKNIGHQVVWASTMLTIIIGGVLIIREISTLDVAIYIKALADIMVTITLVFWSQIAFLKWMSYIPKRKARKEQNAVRP